MRLRRKARDPDWGLESGDVLTFALASGSLARVQVVNSQAPTKEYDYCRLTVRVTDPANLVLAGEPGMDSVVPVGSAAQPIKFSLDAASRQQLTNMFERTLGAGLEPRSTPGLAVLVPADDGGAADDPARAGFQLSSRGAPAVDADGMAVMLRWDTFAERLSAATNRGR